MAQSSSDIRHRLMMDTCNDQNHFLVENQMSFQVAHSSEVSNAPVFQTATTSSTGPSSPNNSMFSFGLGSNLIEIAALTTILGSAAAESLILGNQGPAGLAWATMSSFGLIWVIRSCLAAASPAWLREMISIRTKITDMAIGMELKADSRWTRKVRNADWHPVGIVVDADKLKSTSSSKKQSNPRTFEKWADVYAFDRSISKLISGIPDNTSTDTVNISTYRETLEKFQHNSSFDTLAEAQPILRSPILERQSPPTIYTYAPYTFYRLHSAFFQISVLILSIAKVLECLLLWKRDAGLLCLVTALPWIYFFIAALIFEGYCLTFLRRPAETYGPIDVLAGGLPTMTKPGGPRKIIIGVSRNFRHSPWWRVMCVVGASVCIGSLLIVYMAVGNQSSEVVFTWAGFQILWLFARLLVYHFAGYTDGQMDSRVLVERPWLTLTTDLKERVLNLMAGLAEYMVVIHPRQSLAYQGDVFVPSELKAIILNTASILTYPAASGAGKIEIDIMGVIGDTTLHSAAWITSSPLTSKELYDCCILSLNLPSNLAADSPKLVHLPAVRVLSGGHLPAGAADVEGSFPQFVPKGALNINRKGTWYYWLPYESGGWLLLAHTVGTQLSGKHSVQTMTDVQVTNMLAAGNLSIGLSHVNEVHLTLEASRRARRDLLDLLENT